MRPLLLALARTLIVLWVIQPAWAQAPRCEQASAPQRVALLELYTSEGCDSCPVADDYVRTLYQHGFSAETVVPLALHVDYWDDIGWKDRFASPIFTQRQYWLSAAAHQKTVYTPEVFLDGREVRDWHGAALAQAVRAIHAQASPVAITLSGEARTSDELVVTARASGQGHRAAGALSLFFAVYENGLVSQIGAGENRGMTLQHGFVVRQWATPVVFDARGEAEIRWHQTLPQDARAQNVGFVAFVQNTRTGEVIQAVALAACPVREH